MPSAFGQSCKSVHPCKISQFRFWAEPSCINFFSDFLLLHDFMTELGSCFEMQLLPLIDAHLKLLQENFEKYFTAEQNTVLNADS